MTRTREWGVGRCDLSPFFTISVKYVELVEEARDGAVERFTAEEEQFFPVWRGGQCCVCTHWRWGDQRCFRDFKELRLLLLSIPRGFVSYKATKRSQIGSTCRAYSSRTWSRSTSSGSSSSWFLPFLVGFFSFWAVLRAVFSATRVFLSTFFLSFLPAMVSCGDLGQEQ